MIGRLPSSVDTDIDAEVLYHERLVVVAGPGSKWLRHRKIALPDLANEPWLLPPPDTLVASLVAHAPIATNQAIDALWQAGKFAEAVGPAREVDAVCEKGLGPDHWQTADARRKVQSLEKFAGLPARDQGELTDALRLSPWTRPHPALSY